MPWTTIKPPSGFWLVAASKTRTFHLMPSKAADVEPMCGAKLSTAQQRDGWRLTPPVSSYQSAMRICPKCEALAAEQTQKWEKF